VGRESNYKKAEKGFKDVVEFDGFKMILCSRHDGEFKYLIRGSELRIAKRYDLRVPEIR
jgi:hypothetical protein